MSDPSIIEELRGLMSRNSICAAYIRDRAISEITRLRAELAAWKAEVEAIREYDTMEREPDEDIEHWFARRDIARIKIKKARTATDAIEKEKANGN